MENFSMMIFKSSYLLVQNLVKKLEIEFFMTNFYLFNSNFLIYEFKRVFISSALIFIRFKRNQYETFGPRFSDFISIGGYYLILNLQLFPRNFSEQYPNQNLQAAFSKNPLQKLKKNIYSDRASLTLSEYKFILISVEQFLRN